MLEQPKYNLSTPLGRLGAASDVIRRPPPAFVEAVFEKLGRDEATFARFLAMLGGVLAYEGYQIAETADLRESATLAFLSATLGVPAAEDGREGAP